MHFRVACDTHSGGFWLCLVRVSVCRDTAVNPAAPANDRVTFGNESTFAGAVHEILSVESNDILYFMTLEPVHLLARSTGVAENCGAAKVPEEA